MKRSVPAVLGFVVALSALAQQTAAEKPKADATPPEMVTYYMGFLVKGPVWGTGDSAERERMQESHLQHMRDMHAAGKLVLAGPFTDDGNVRGIVIYKTATFEEAKAAAEADPAVKVGRLKVELHPWIVQKGVLP